MLEHFEREREGERKERGGGGRVGEREGSVYLLRSMILLLGAYVR